MAKLYVARATTAILTGKREDKKHRIMCFCVEREDWL